MLNILYILFKYMKLIENKTDYADTIINSSLPIIVDFYADWCGPCKRLSPILDNLDKQYENKILFLKINVDNDDCNDICTLYDIQSMPTILFIKNNIEDKDLRILGFNENLLKSNIEKLTN